MPSDESISIDVNSGFRIGTLLYFNDEAGRLLLMKRKRPPNLGAWCAVGGKLEMSSGESPYECAVRESAEEVGVVLTAGDLALRSILSEKDYQGSGHWLMFVFQVKPALRSLPSSIDEGEFGFFSLDDLDALEIPELDREILVQRILRDDTSLHILRSDGDGVPLVEESLVSG